MVETVVKAIVKTSTGTVKTIVKAIILKRSRL